MPAFIHQDDLRLIKQRAALPECRIWVQSLIEPEARAGLLADLDWARHPSGSEADWTCPVHNQDMHPDPAREGVLVCPADQQVFTGPSRESAIRFFRHETLALGARSLALLAHLDDDASLAQRACLILDAYAQSYPHMPLSSPADFWRTGKATPFFLLESTWCLALLSAAETLRETGHVPDLQWRRWRDAIFLPCAEAFMHRVPLIHNIRSWVNAMTCSIGIAFEDDGLKRHAIDAEFGLRDQLARGLLPDGTWCETSTLYQFYCLQAMVIQAQAMKRAGMEDGWINHRMDRMTQAALRYLLPDTTMIPANDTASATLVSPWLCATLRVTSRDATVQAVAGRRLDMLRGELQSGKPANLALCRHGGRAHVDLLLPAPAPSRPASVLQRGLRPTFKTNVPPSAILDEDSLLRRQALVLSDEQGNVAFMEQGPKAASHMHYERLGLLLWLQGKPVLMDRGAIGYHLEHYNFYRYTPAHNTMALWNWHHLHDGMSQVLEQASTRFRARVHIHQGIFLTRTCELVDGVLVDELDWEASIQLPGQTMVDLYLHPAGEPAFPMHEAVQGDFEMSYFGFTGMKAPRRVDVKAGSSLLYHNADYDVHLHVDQMPASTQAWCLSTPGLASEPHRAIKALVLRTPFASRIRYVCRYALS